MREPGPETSRERDQVSEVQERDAFVLLLHALTVSEADLEREHAEERLARDLAFEPDRIRQLVDHLGRVGYMHRRSVGRVLVTREGLEYVERAAQHRRSVRYSRPAPRILRFRT